MVHIATAAGLLAVVGFILLDDGSGAMSFSSVTPENRPHLAQILSPQELSAYQQEHEEIQLMHQEVQRDVEQAAAAHPFQNPEALLRFSSERWLAHGQAALSPHAQHAVAKIASQLLH